MLLIFKSIIQEMIKCYSLISLTSPGEHANDLTFGKYDVLDDCATTNLVPKTKDVVPLSLFQASFKI